MTTRWFTMKEATVYAGVSLSTLKRAVAERRVKYGTVGNGRSRTFRRFSVEQLDAWLLGRRPVSRAA